MEVGDSYIMHVPNINVTSANSRHEKIKRCVGHLYASHRRTKKRMREKIVLLPCCWLPL